MMESIIADLLSFLGFQGIADKREQFPFVFVPRQINDAAFSPSATSPEK
jgi:hypothetical protein